MAKQILVVDDEELLLCSLAGALRNDGHAVTAVSSGEEALYIVKNGKFDICFLDVQLPDANGIELVPVMVKVSPFMRIIIMTALDLADAQLVCLGRFSCRFLPKPFSLERVRTLIRTT